MKVSWLEFGEDWPANPARHMVMKTMSFLRMGQFCESVHDPVPWFRMRHILYYSPTDLLGHHLAVGSERLHLCTALGSLGSLGAMDSSTVSTGKDLGSPASDMTVLTTEKIFLQDKRRKVFSSSYLQMIERREKNVSASAIYCARGPYTPMFDRRPAHPRSSCMVARPGSTTSKLKAAIHSNTN